MCGDPSNLKNTIILNLGDGKYLGIHHWDRVEDVVGDTPECLEFYHSDKTEYDDKDIGDITDKKRLEQPRRHGRKETHLYYSVEDGTWLGE